MQRPSGVKEWQIPARSAEPKLPLTEERSDPEEEQETSYLAASAKIANLSVSDMLINLSAKRLFRENMFD